PPTYRLSLHDALPISGAKNADQESVIGQQLGQSDLLEAITDGRLSRRDGAPPKSSREGAQLDQRDIAALLDFFLLLDQWDRQKRSEEHTSELQSLAYL